MNITTINSIVIYGFGVVGREFYKHANDQVRIQISDPKYQKTIKAAQASSADAAVICLPTEINEDGSRNITKLRTTIDAIPQDLILIRTLLDPGTIAELEIVTGKKLVYCPYIPKTVTNEDDMNDPDFLVIGGAKDMSRPWVTLLQRMYGHETKYIQCSSVEAEVIASTILTFLALKVTFVNEMYEIAQATGADWNIVREGWLASNPSVSEGTTVRPDQRGYGGKTLPREVLHAVVAAGRHGYQPRLLTEVHNSNLVFAVEYLSEFLKHAHDAQANNHNLEFRLVTPKLHPAEGVWFKIPAGANV